MNLEDIHAAFRVAEELLGRGMIYASRSADGTCAIGRFGLTNGRPPGVRFSGRTFIEALKRCVDASKLLGPGLGRFGAEAEKILAVIRG